MPYLTSDQQRQVHLRWLHGCALTAVLAFTGGWAVRDPRPPAPACYAIPRTVADVGHKWLCPDWGGLQNIGLADEDTYHFRCGKHAVFYDVPVTHGGGQ